MKVVAYAYANGYLFADDCRSECVVKLTRNEQAEYGFTAPLVTLAEAEAAVKQARIDALDLAMEMCRNMVTPTMPSGISPQSAYEAACIDCEIAIDSLKGTP